MTINLHSEHLDWLDPCQIKALTAILKTVIEKCSTSDGLLIVHVVYSFRLSKLASPESFLL